MKIVFAFSGTRGDIQPAVVIGAELRRRGHDVVFGAPPNLVEFASSLGLDVKSFGYDTRAHMNSDLVRNARTGSLSTRIRALAEIRDFGWAQIVREMHDLCLGADAIVAGVTVEQVAFNFAESAGIPLIALHHAPIVANRHFPPFPGAPLSLPHWMNRASWALFDKAVWLLTRRRENRLRTELGLAAADTPLPDRVVAYGCTQIQAYDKAFVPELADEWDRDRPFVGFVDLEASQRSAIGEDRGLDPELRKWIDDGPAPVYFGFGSMPISDPAALLSAVSAVCAELGERALVSAGWNDFTFNNPQHVMLVGAVDHDQVFPLCTAVVHHGGAGTTAAGIRAGCPTMICWVGSDQPFWGAQLTRLAIGTSTPLNGLDATRLRSGLRAVLVGECRARVREFGPSLVTPADAVSKAADIIENHVMSGRSHAQNDIR